MRIFVLLFAVLSLSACWEAEEKIYDARDFYVPVTGEIISLTDGDSLIGLYRVTDQNQFTPIYTETSGQSNLQPFRKLDIGFVPIDRMAVFSEPNENWQQQRALSRSVFSDGDTLLFIAVASHEEQSGQYLFVSHIKGRALSLCPSLLKQGTHGHKNFLEAAALRGPANALRRKTATATLVLSEIMAAHHDGGLSCDLYEFQVHPESERGSLLEAIRASDQRRGEKAEADAAVMRADAVAMAETATETRAAEDVPVPPDTSSSQSQSLEQKRAELARRDAEIAALQKRLYDINRELTSKEWGTVDDVGGQYYAVRRRFRDEGLLFRAKMQCHNMVGYEALYVTVTHDASPGSNAAWIMRGNRVAVRVETERGKFTYQAALEVRDNVQFTNILSLYFADLVPSRRDRNFLQDPRQLEQLRQQAALFGQSVESMTRMGYNLLSLESALKSETFRLYADIRQNGQTRSVFLGDFGIESDQQGLSGFHDACLFSE